MTPAVLTDPAYKPIRYWLPANQGFYEDFRVWLRRGGYGDSALEIYSTAVRLALSLLDTPYWLIDPQADLDRVRTYLNAHYPSAGTRASYRHGLLKLAAYLRLRCHCPAPEKPVNWPFYLDPLPRWLADDVRAYMTHRGRCWLPEARRRATLDLLSPLTTPLR